MTRIPGLPIVPLKKKNYIKINIIITSHENPNEI